MRRNTRKGGKFNFSPEQNIALYKSDMNLFKQFE